MNFPIYLSISQARANLPKVSSHLRRIQQLYAELEILSGIEIESEPEDQELDLLSARLSKSFHKKMYLFHKYWQELILLGAVVQDVEDGHVEFYSNFEGRDIYFCWHQGDRDISYWHEVDHDHDQRQHISVLKQNRIH
jgi:hypothetical protein